MLIVITITMGIFVLKTTIYMILIIVTNGSF